MNSVIEFFNKNYYSRWLSLEEIENTKDIELVDINGNIKKAGIPVGSKDGKLLVDTSIGNNLVVGAIGSGKTQSTILPMLYLMAKTGESVIVNDSSDELYKATANYFKDNGYNVVVLNFNNPEMSNCWNPLSLATRVYKEGRVDEALKLIDSFAKKVNYAPTNCDPFWSNTASQYMTGLLMSLMDDAKEEVVNLNSLSYLTTLSDDELLDSYISKIDKNSVIYKNIASTFLAPFETKSSILSVLNQNLATYLNNDSLSKVLSYTDFDLYNIANNKTIVYVITSLGVQHTDVLYNTFIEQVNYVLANNTKVFNILLNNFDYLKVPMSNVQLMLDEGRKKYIRYTIFIGGIVNVDRLYKNIERCGSFKQSLSSTLYLYSDENEILFAIKEMCGKKDRDSYLISRDALKRIGEWQGIYIKRRTMPYPTVLEPFYDYQVEKIEEASLEEKEHKDISIFNIEL